jgi:hypothetical protein
MRKEVTMTAPAPALEDITATVTRQLIALAEAGGLRPHVDPGRSKHGRVGIIVNGEGRDALFGVIYLSARKGTVLRAFLTHGNWGEQKRYDTVAEIRSVLKSWVALQAGETATPARTNREGYVYQGGTLIGRVVKVEDKWQAYVQQSWNSLLMRPVGNFATKREAVDETIIMREV